MKGAADPPVTAADREKALADRLNGELPPQPFDPKAGYRAWKRQMAEDAGNVQLPTRIINPGADFDDKPIPPRLWVVKDYIPLRAVTGLYGDGGTGKSLIAQGLQTSCAVGADWFGLQVAQCRSFGFYCEDDADELHRRQDTINRAIGIGFKDLEPVRYASRSGEDNLLMTFDASGIGHTTPLFDDVIAVCLDHGARLAIIDTAADTFGGNENIRPQVRQFVGACLGKLAQTIAGAVVLLVHPSRAGLATGEGDGGSTAWNASVRSRLYLSRVKPEAEGEADDDRRTLSRRKANYSAIGDDVPLVWRDGYFVPERGPVGGVLASIANRNAENLFLELLDELSGQGRNATAAVNSPSYAPKIMKASTKAKALKVRDLSLAMERLFADGRIRVAQYGPPAHGKTRIERAIHA